MFIAGSVTITLALCLGEIRFFELVNVIPPILIFGLSANLFYTLGWITEIVCKKVMQQKEFLFKTGPVLFIGGIVLSVFFTIAIDIAIIISFLFEK